MRGPDCTGVPDSGCRIVLSGGGSGCRGDLVLHGAAYLRAPT
ncbi:MAG: hypothetical protein QF733_01490 [Phycisphaerales bacterium]|nr:hypothetical protein [Phycisphaerales bacterium]